MNRFPLKIYFLILIGLPLLFGCDETFDLPPYVYVGAEISYLNSTYSDSTFYFSLRRLGTDSLLVDNTTSGELSFPLSTNDSSTYILTIDAIIDTMTVYHKNTLIEESIESGFYYEYEIISINFTKNRIDSIAIPDSTITSIWNENLEIYINNNN